MTSRTTAIVRRIIESFDGVTVLEVVCNKHMKFTLQTPSGKQQLITSKTPSDHRALRNIEAQLKRWSNTKE
jgi:hypothetical protein